MVVLFLKGFGEVVRNFAFRIFDRSWAIRFRFSVGFLSGCRGA